jgi:hypothetical protein
VIGKNAEAETGHERDQLICAPEHNLRRIVDGSWQFLSRAGSRSPLRGGG